MPVRGFTPGVIGSHGSELPAYRENKRNEQLRSGWFASPPSHGCVATIRRMTRIGTTPLVLLALAAVFLVAFGLWVVPVNTDPGPDTVTGQIVSVEPASVTTILSLTLVDDSGRQWKFEGGGTFAGLTPSHLEEHMALRDQVTVEYETTATGILKILKVSD